MAPQGVSALAHDDRAHVAERALPADRLPGHRSTTPHPGPDPGRRAWTRSTPSSSQRTRNSVSRSRSARCWRAWRWTRCSTACPSRPRSRTSLPRSASSSVRSRRRCRSIQSWCDSISALSCLPATTSLRRSTRRSSRDGSFCYIPKGVRCPMELSTYFRINAKNTGQFERTLIVADEGSLGVVSRGLYRTDAGREPAARGGGGVDRARPRARSSTRRSRTGTPATRKARAASTTS